MGLKNRPGHSCRAGCGREETPIKCEEYTRRPPSDGETSRILVHFLLLIVFVQSNPTHSRVASIRIVHYLSACRSRTAVHVRHFSHVFILDGETCGAHSKSEINPGAYVHNPKSLRQLVTLALSQAVNGWSESTVAGACGKYVPGTNVFIPQNSSKCPIRRDEWSNEQERES